MGLWLAFHFPSFHDSLKSFIFPVLIYQEDTEISSNNIGSQLGFAKKKKKNKKGFAKTKMYMIK